MACKLLLIRHGETVWNLERRCQGFSDIPLSEAGEDQAKALARALRNDENNELDAVYSSDLVRARRTAEFIAAPHRIQVKVDARLRELNQGDLEGLKFTDLLADHPDLLKKWMSSPAEVAMPGGESMQSLQSRAWRAIEEIVAAHPGQKVAVVSHNLCTLTIICRSIGLDLNKFRSFKIENASITRIDFTKIGRILIGINDTNHLRLNVF